MAGFKIESVYTIPITPFVAQQNTSQPLASAIEVSGETAIETQSSTNSAIESATPSGVLIPATDSGTLETQSLDPCVGNPDTIICQTTTLEIGQVIGNLIQFIFIVAVILALGFLVFGGIKWLTSGGNKDNVETARGTIISAIIGLIIVFLSYAILNLVLTFLIGTGIANLQIPSMTTMTN